MITRRYCLAALVACAAAVLAPAGAQQPGLTEAQIDRIEQLIASEMARQGIPGLAAAVAIGDRPIWTNGYGFADLENHVPTKATTMFRLASISKPITAVAAMQLWEQGKLDLDAPIQNLVPAFPQKAWPVTCRQLLGHLGGVRHYKGDENASTRRYDSLTDALGMFKDDPLAHEPGTKYQYTSYGFNLLGCAVEAASEQAFPRYVNEKIFRAAGMRRIRPDRVEELIPNRAQGYRKLPDGGLRNSILADVSNKLPGGGFIGTAEDLVRFAAAFNEGRLVRAETHALMTTRQRTRDGQEIGYGLGWAIGERDGRKTVSHGGAQPRVATLLYTLPNDRAAVSLMANLEGSRLIDLAAQILDAAR